MPAAPRTGADGEPVRITTAPMTLAELCRVADGARVELDAQAIDRIEAGRAVVDRALQAGLPVYGLNTGLGHLMDQVVEPELLRMYQVAIVALHDGAVGEALPARVVRAAMLARLNGIARGGSGARLAVAQQLVSMLDAGIHPIVPRVGSVGASDLMHMAAIASVIIGRGQAEVAGNILDGAAALAAVGLEPLVLEPKDGLALISANGVAIGHGALVVERAGRLLEAADVVASASMEVVRANPTMLDPVVAAAKPMPGQIAASAHLRTLLAGSGLWAPGGPARLQDPLSFRVVPQVHGAGRDVLDFVRDAVTVELNAMDDNPLVDIGQDRMIHNGNFHPMTMAIGFDALRVALAHVGQISDRRMDPPVARGACVRGPVQRGGAAGPDREHAARHAALRGRGAVRGAAGAGGTRDPRYRQPGPGHGRIMRPTPRCRSSERRSRSTCWPQVLAIELIIAARHRQLPGGPASTAPAVASALEWTAERIAGLGPTASSAAVAAAVADDLADGVLAAAEAAIAGRGPSIEP